ncbi:hypothetical protein V6N13_093008 [Hibiscus sabdariffa]
MVETKRSRGQSSVMNETTIEENLESDDSEYMPYEHENLESDLLDSENDHCDASDEVCDEPVHESLHSASSDNSDIGGKKGLIETVLELCPHAGKSNCVRHMYSNFKNGEGFKGKALKDVLWKVARATTVRGYEKAMAEMKGISIDAYN